MKHPAQAIQLFRFTLSGHSHRAELFLSLLGLPVEAVDVDLLGGQQKTPAYLAMNRFGQVPVIQDGDVLLAESGAIVEYIVARYGKGRLVLAPDHPDFASFLYWFPFANGTLQPATGRNMILGRLDLPADNPLIKAMKARLDLALGLVEARLGTADYLAGAERTTADIMAVFSLTTMRNFLPFDLAPYPAIRAYLQRIAARPAYQRAMQKGDPGMPLLLT